MTTLTRVEPAPYRVRAWKDGRVIVDSRRAKIGFGARPPNFWLFPKEDVTAPAEDIEAEHDALVAVKWSAADEWWEEDERVWGEHPRDPRHRVDVRQSSRHVVVSWQGTVIAESHRPVLLFETELPLHRGSMGQYGERCRWPPCSSRIPRQSPILPKRRPPFGGTSWQAGVCSRHFAYSSMRFSSTSLQCSKLLLQASTSNCLLS